MRPTSKVQRLFYGLYAYLAIFVGVTSYRYDYNRKVYRNSKWTQFVAYLGNLFVIVIMPMYIYDYFSTNLKKDTATELTIRLDMFVNNSICLLRVLQRFSIDNANKQIIEQLERLQRINRYRYRAMDFDRHMERIYLLKNCLMWVCLVFLMCFMMLTFDELNGDLYHPTVGRVITVFYVLVMDGVNITIQMHFILTWHICRFYKCLNVRIGELIKVNDATVTLELHHLCWQHWQLTKLMQRLNVSYNFTLICSRLSLIITATSLGYYLNVFFDLEYHIIYSIVAFTLYAIISLDCYMLDLLYDMTKLSYRQTSWQLRQLNELINTDEQLSKVCELFVLQATACPLEIKPYGLYDTGKSTWLRNIMCIFSWMIVLLQYRIVSQRRERKV